MIQTVRFFIALFSVCLFTGCGSCGHGGDDGSSIVEAEGEIVAQLQQCSRLYTTEYHIHKLVASESDRHIEGAGFSIGLDIFGDRKIVIPINATVKGYIDFSGFSEENVERKDGKIVITLPDPEVMLTSTKVDHEGIRSYVTGFRDEFSDSEMAALEQEGRKAVIASIPSLHVERSARESAVRLLVPLLVQMGFSEGDIVIRFRHDFTPVDLIRKLD